MPLYLPSYAVKIIKAGKSKSTKKHKDSDEDGKEEVSEDEPELGSPNNSRSDEGNLFNLRFILDSNDDELSFKKNNSHKSEGKDYCIRDRRKNRKSSRHIRQSRNKEVSSEESD